ncbi:hypothetical protein BKA70DRAFT_554589 [Coprinopsis sp. MPI-PUGE-AT-0042]|nr:hypothetical protein BKA70DRAFT_554589 [Coprinopsis sp. MPI-PUGE-AT-0042]
MRATVPPQNYLAWKVCITALHAVAISATVLRIRIRWRRAKLWWDDYVAAAAMLVTVVFAITFWLLFGSYAGAPTPLIYTKLNWLNLALYFSIFWSSRVSLALSIARVFPAGTVARKALLAMAVLFVTLLIIISVLIGSLCAWSPSIYPPGTIILEEYANCQPGTMRYLLAGGIGAAADFLSDIMGIVVPLAFLWRISLPPNERRLVHGSIWATLITTMSGVVACVFWYAPIDLGKDYQIIVSGIRHQQAATSLIICNLLVVVTYWWRKAYRRNGPAPRRYRHNDPNIPTSRTSSQSPSVASGSRSDDGDGSSINPRSSLHPEDTSRFPENLTFTPITPLSAESGSNPVWA